jgi:hypothetical protein
MNTDWDNTIQNMTQEQKKKFKTLSKKQQAFVIKGEQELMAKKNTTVKVNAKPQKNKSGPDGKASLGDNDSNLCGVVIGNYVSFEDQHGILAKPYEEVVHPAHYNALPNGIECWDVTEHFPANIAMGMKHLWRAGLKPNNDTVKELDKALQYIQRQKDLLTGKVNKM